MCEMEFSENIIITPKNYYTFRYTLSSEEDELYQSGPQKGRLIKFRALIVEVLNPDKFTCGYETMNKYGEPTAPHIHVNFTTDTNLATIRKRFQRYMKDCGEERKGNALYSLANLTKDLQDEDAFFRYPLKQNGKLYDEDMRLKLPEGFDLEEQRKLAYHQWQNNIEYHKKSRDRRDEKESTFDKMVAEFDTRDDLTTFDIVLTSVVEYYQKKKLSMNLQTMTGYAVSYAHQKGIIPTHVLVLKMRKIADLNI